MTADPPSRWQALVTPLLASLTLGLAPFVPEPHIVGKIRWIVGGAEGMQPLDWFDVVLHGAPWLWLLGALVTTLLRGNAPASRAPEAAPPDAPGTQ